MTWKLENGLQITTFNSTLVLCAQNIGWVRSGTVGYGWVWLGGMAVKMSRRYEKFVGP